VTSFTIASGLCLVEIHVSHIKKSRILFVNAENDTATPAAITAIGSSERYEFFTSKTAKSITAFPGAELNDFFV
jgi:hypothetical protein